MSFMPWNEHTRKQIAELLNKLQNLGCSRSNILGLQYVHFAGCRPSTKLKVIDVPKFAQLVRQATCFERNGLMIAEINRLGEVIGWHAREGF